MVIRGRIRTGWDSNFFGSERDSDWKISQTAHLWYPTLQPETKAFLLRFQRTLKICDPMFNFYAFLTMPTWHASIPPHSCHVTFRSSGGWRHRFRGIPRTGPDTRPTTQLSGACSSPCSCKRCAATCRRRTSLRCGRRFDSTWLPLCTDDKRRSLTKNRRKTNVRRCSQKTVRVQNKSRSCSDTL